MEINPLSFLRKSSEYFSLPQLSICVIDNIDNPMNYEINHDYRNIYKLGSVTKMVTALAIIYLEENNKLSISDSISKYLSDKNYLKLDSIYKKITIKDLLLHTSALPRGNFIDFSPSIEYINDMLLSKYDAINDSNYKGFKYSNLGYILLGFIIEKVSSLSFADYIDTIFFKPLSMNNSGFGRKVNIEMLTTAHSLTYFNQESSSLFNTISIDRIEAPHAAFDMHSTIDDMGKLMQCVLNEGKYQDRIIIPKNTIKMFFELKSKINHVVNSSLGLQSMNAFNETVYFQNGEHWGHSASILLLPNRKLGILALANRGSAGYNLSFIVQSINRYHIYSKNPKYLTFNYKNPPFLIGVFLSEDNCEIQISTNIEGKTFMSVDGEKKSLLIYFGQNTFFKTSGKLRKYLIRLDVYDQKLIGIFVGPYYFRNKTVSAPRKYKTKYNEIIGIYSNPIIGRVAIFERNTQLILAYSPFKEAILKRKIGKIFLQIEGPFNQEEVSVDAKKKELVIGNVTFSKTNFFY